MHICFLYLSAVNVLMLSLMTGLDPIDYEVHTISTDVSTLALHFPVKIFQTSSTLLRFLFLRQKFSPLDEHLKRTEAVAIRPVTWSLRSHYCEFIFTLTKIVCQRWGFLTICCFYAHTM